MTLLVKAKRELSHPSFFGFYRRFWRGCVWEKWLQPHPMGFIACHKLPLNNLEFRPGVYEFALSKSNNLSGSSPELEDRKGWARGKGKRYKVYVGESGSIRKRHQTYAKNGDHLFLLLDAAVREGCTVWRRCKYVKTKKKAVAKEAKLLRKYDYSWNAQQNIRKRSIRLVHNRLCLCMSSIKIVE